MVEAFGTTSKEGELQAQGPGNRQETGKYEGQGKSPHWKPIPPYLKGGKGEDIQRGRR